MTPKNKEMLVNDKGDQEYILRHWSGVFLWVLTEEEGLAAIGFLIFCMGWDKY